ncbi:MAG: HAMP domain-containing histidine kinase, partial [Sulfurospirillaceae bacterium]|nr:HAMP domain-containing histidine kinase [Sulfurospirillaceae bacterium]
QGRLAQMGEMLSMIAHQWRQPLNVISAINSAIRLKTFKDKIDKEYLLEKLNETNEQVKYLSNTIEDFRSFFKPNIEKKEVLAKKIIEDTLKIIKSSIDSRAIDIVLNIETDMSLFTYKNRVIQVLLTIIKNAKEAIEQKNIENGKIIISTKKENERLTIEVCDNGTGIEDEKLEKIFLPYFTTKHESVGTGIGLYMSKVIIEEHCGGKLTAHNNSDGVCFKITL